jgi:hypothetical protein
MTNLSEQKNSNPVDQEVQINQAPVQSPVPANDVSKSEVNRTMSKREIMEELSRQRFPWEE